MKINYTMYGTEVNGGVRVILEIANGLVERGHDVSITTVGQPADTAWFPFKGRIFYTPRIDQNVWFRALRKTFPRFRPQSHLFAEYASDILKIIPDCDINVATSAPTVFPVFESEKGKLFYHMQHHEVVFFTDPRVKRQVQETYWLPLNKIANCIWLKNQIETNYQAKGLPIINPAINYDVFKAEGPKQPHDGVTVISLGRNEEWKGLPDLIKAMENVMKQEKNVRWQVFGVSKPKFWSDAAPYEFIQGPVNHQLAELYRSSDIAVNPSWYESFPLPPIEAMACGTATVTTPFGTEDYARDGETALVVPPQNPLKMAEAILKLVQDQQLRQKLVENGLQEAKKYTWENAVNKAEQIFKAA